MKMLKFIIMCLLLSSSMNLFSQLSIDLSDKKDETESIDINNLKPFVVIKHLLPNQSVYNYSVKIEHQEESIPSFEVGSLSGAECEESDDNLEYRNSRRDFLDAKEENELPDLINRFQKEIDDLDEEYNGCKIEGRALIANTIYKKNLGFTLRNNQTITVTVKRTVNKDTTTWTRVFKTPKKSPWKVMYGFTFVPNSLSKVDNFFTKETDGTNQSYTISKLNNNDNKFWENTSPTIMFQWAPSTLKENGGKAIQLGFAGGLSLNFSKETGIANVMAGPSIIIAENLTISGGLIFIQKNVLRGQYKEGDVINENLDFDQLHDKKFMLENFISIAFRFDKNPFSGKDEAQKD